MSVENQLALVEMPFCRVDSAAMFGSTVAAALATPAPTRVEVDMRAIGPVPP